MRKKAGEQCSLMWKDWLDSATRAIQMHPDCDRARRELLDHLEDRAECLARLYPDMKRGEVEKRALAAMGSPEEIGMGLKKAHSMAWGGLYWMTFFLSRMVLVLVGVEFLYMLVTVILPLNLPRWPFW